EAVVMRQLAKDPRARLGPPGSFAAALTAALTGAPTGAGHFQSLLTEAQAALASDDLDRAEHLLADALTAAAGPNGPTTAERSAMAALEQQLGSRRVRQYDLADIRRALDAGDWRTALERIQRLEQGGETGLDGYRQHAEALRQGA